MMKYLLLASLICSDAWAAEQPTELNLELAQKIASKAAACGKTNSWKLTIAIVNSEGNLVYFQRGDGTYVGSIEAALEKAKSANAFQRPTKAFVDGVKDGRTGLLSVPGVVALEGGMPIQLKDKFVGAIGISGARSTEDDQCAKKALEN